MHSQLTELITRTAHEMASGSDFLSASRMTFEQLRPSLPDVQEHLSQATELDRARLLDGSHETSTHYKWLMYRQYDPKLTLWLHEYKDSGQRRQGYAEVPHNHRYGLTSFILAGGYEAATWRETPGELDQVDAMRHGTGDIIALDSEAIHSLTTIDDGTITLVLEGPAVRGFSRAFYPDPPYRREYPDFQARYPVLLAQLAGRRAPGSGPGL